MFAFSHLKGCSTGIHQHYKIQNSVCECAGLLHTVTLMELSNGLLFLKSGAINLKRSEQLIDLTIMLKRVFLG